jgi:hypothetical protein
MVEIILSEQQLACLKDAVPTDSDESAALQTGETFGSGVVSPAPIALKCTFEVAARLLTVAQQSCPDVVPEIRAAMEEARRNLLTRPRPPSD